ncbi:hypothetical protein ABZ897_58430 [Nonomuraea sp. NPDC046802]
MPFLSAGALPHPAVAATVRGEVVLLESALIAGRAVARASSKATAWW